MPVGNPTTRTVSGPSEEPLRVMLLISSLEYGGAERQVVHLANHLDPSHYDVTVCSLSRHVPLAADLVDRPHRLHIVEKKSRFDVSTVVRVARLMKRMHIQVVHAFLFDAEMVARLAAKLASVPVVVGSERNSNYQRSRLHSTCAYLTKPLCDSVIANSEAGRRFVVRSLGISPDRVEVVRNGVDIRTFRPGDRTDYRRRLGLPDGVPVVGMVGSFKRQKNHGDFLRMAQLVLQRFPETQFLMAGEPLRDNQQGADEYHGEIRRMVNELGISANCEFIGNCNDMPSFYGSCDVTVLLSLREGTPNVLLESMACGVPVVANDVADNSQVVPNGQVGFVVDVGDVKSASEHVISLLSDAAFNSTLGDAARRWVEEQFSLEKLAERSGAIYADLWKRKAGRKGL